MPSRRRPRLVEALAARVAALGRLELHPAVRRAADTPPQSAMANSAHQCANALAAFAVDGPLPAGPVLLVDDVTASGWTLTVVGALLREAGADRVLPLVLQRRP